MERLLRLRLRLRLRARVLLLTGVGGEQSDRQDMKP